MRGNGKYKEMAATEETWGSNTRLSDAEPSVLWTPACAGTVHFSSIKITVLLEISGKQTFNASLHSFSKMHEINPFLLASTQDLQWLKTFIKLSRNKNIKIVPQLTHSHIIKGWPCLRLLTVWSSSFFCMAGASVLPGNFLEMQSMVPPQTYVIRIQFASWKLGWFHKLSRWFFCILKFEKHQA